MVQVACISVRSSEIGVAIHIKISDLIKPSNQYWFVAKAIKFFKIKTRLSLEHVISGPPN